MSRARTDDVPDPKFEALLAEVSREAFGSEEERGRLRSTRSNGGLTRSAGGSLGG